MTVLVGGMTSLDAAQGVQPVSQAVLAQLGAWRDQGRLAGVHATNAPAASSTALSSKLIILIQDVHVDYDTQKQISQLLQDLVTQHGLRLILAEGGAGDISVAHLRAFRSKDSRLQLAERYLSSGVFSGHEYLDLISDAPLLLWGVEDPARYAENLERFLDVERVDARAQAQLAGLRQIADRISAKRLTPAVRLFIERGRQFDRNALTTEAYMTYLLKEADRAGLAHSAYPGVDAFVELTRLSQTVDLTQVTAEQRRLLGHLQSRLDAEATARLVSAAQELKAGRLDKRMFYQQLAGFMQTAGIAPGAFPRTEAYQRYLHLEATLDVSQVLRDIHQLRQDLRRHVAASAEEGQWLEVEASLSLLERLVKLEWLPEDYAAYRQTPATVAALLPVIRQQAAAAGIEAAWDGHAEWLDGWLASAVGFYEAAEGRNADMVSRSVSKMDAESQPIAALIMGGFHTDELSRRFAEQGVQVIVVTMPGGESHDAAYYHDVLKAKYHASNFRHANTAEGGARR